MDERDLANASQPSFFDSVVMSFQASGFIPINLWNKSEVAGEEMSPVIEQDEPLFGTHIKEAASVIRDLIKK